jgi:dTDP-4-amino-4,6-dideoxygalactose transaminase
LLVTDDDHVAAKAILYSGSYMFYDRHLSRPELNIFEAHRYMIPNLSLRMSNLQAALIRPQLRILDQRVEEWNKRYHFLAAGLKATPRIHLPDRPAVEKFVGSSIQFSLVGVSRSKAEAFAGTCQSRGVSVMWFGWREPRGYTSRYQSWQYFSPLPTLNRTDALLDVMCDMRIPLTFSLEDCELILSIIRDVLGSQIE